MVLHILAGLLRLQLHPWTLARAASGSCSCLSVHAGGHQAVCALSLAGPVCGHMWGWGMLCASELCSVCRH